MNEVHTVDLDDYLERRLDKCMLMLQTAKTPRARRQVFAQMQALHARRSASKVAQLEREKGLR